MKNIKKKSWIITIVVTVVITICCLFIYKIFQADTLSRVMRCLCNSFFVSGGIVFLMGLLIWCTNQGALTGLSYGFKQIFEKRRFEKAFSEREKYGDYRERRLKKQHDFIHMVIIGGAFIILSIVFLLFV